MYRRLLILILLLIVPFLLTGCGLKQRSKQPTKAVATPTPTTSSQVGGLAPVSTSSYLGLDPAAEDQSIQETLKLAQQKAGLWQKDALLHHFSAKFTPDFQIGRVTQTFTFGSPADAYNWWTMTVSGKTGKIVRALVPKEDYLGTSLVSVPLRFWKMNYIAALQLAETSGGADFRASHPDSEVTASLAVGQPKNYLWWIVEYSSDTSEPYRILVNPATKEVFSETGQSLGGTAPTSSEPQAAPQTIPSFAAEPPSEQTVPSEPVSEE